MSSKPLHAWVVVFSLAAPGLYAQPSVRPAFAQKLQACRVPGLDEMVLCGHYEAPEDRTKPTGQKIALNLVVLPATTDSVLNDPLAFLAGGGVVPATRYAGFLARAFPKLRHKRDILLLDQRGTWGSHELSCGDDRNPSTSMRQCMDSLSAIADLRQYNTVAAVEDLDAVRAWLGYQTLNLYGVSYGTKVAQAFVKKYPARVRSVVLYGVVPLSAPSQLDLARFAQSSLQLVFARCAEDAACHAAFPRPAEEFDSVLARLKNAPAQLASTQQPPITDRAVRNLIQGMLGSARSSERIPLLLHRAYAGDLAAIARALDGRSGPPPPPGPPRGVFFSILCSEAIPQFRPEDVEPATRGSFFGDAPVRSQMRICGDWPRAGLPGDFWQPVKASVPVLAISGDLDPITPPAYAEIALKSWPGARQLVVRNRSHGDVDPCITGLFEAFLMNGGAAQTDTSCVNAPMPLRFATVL